MPDEIQSNGQPATTEAPAPATSGNDPFAGSPAPEWTQEAGVKHEEKPAVTTETPAPAATPPATPPVNNGITPEMIATAVAAGVEKVVAAQPQNQPKPREFTQEEVDQQLGVFKASEADYEELFGVKPDKPERVAKLNNILQAVVKQALTSAHLMNNHALMQFRESMNPYVETVRQQEAVRQKESFFKEFEDLKDYGPLVDQVYQNAVAQGKKFPDVAAARKFVAETTRGLLKSIGVAPKTAAPTTTPSKGTTPAPNPSTRQMTTTSVGGRSGGNSGSPQSKDMVSSVWGQ